MIDQVADLINDHQCLHVDPKRARTSLFDASGAHGFLSLSIFRGLASEFGPELAGREMCTNYRYDKVRFVAPVWAGRKVRSTLTLRQVARRDALAVDLLYDATLDVDDEQKPAIAAQWCVRVYFGELNS